MLRFARTFLAVAAILAGGCRSADPSSRPVELWALGREGEVARKMVRAFEKENPGIRVHVQQIPWSAAHEKLLTAYVGESMPDVFQLGNTWVPEFAALGALEPLGERVEKATTDSAADYFPGILDTNVIDGSLAALPWYVDTRLLFYRKDLLAEAGFAEPPRDWATWKVAMEKVRERGSAGSFAILLPVNEWAPLVILGMERGSPLLAQGDTRAAFSSPEFREAFRFYVELFRSGLAPITGQTAIANVYQEFARGTFVFYLTGPWNLEEFADRLPKGMEDRWATMPMPAPDGGATPGTSLAGGSSLAIFRGSPRKEAAWKLVEWMVAPEQQRELYRRSGDLPGRRSAWPDGGPDSDPRAAAFRTQLERVRATPKIPEWERIADAVARHAEAAIRAGTPTEEALAGLDAEVDQILEKRRWMLVRRGARS